MKQLIIWGAGAHAGNLLATLKRLSEPRFAGLAMICDLADPKLPWPLPLLGDRRQLETLDPAQYAVFPAVGMPAQRQLMMAYLQALGFEIPTLIDPDAVIESDVELGAGCLIRAQCFVGYRARLGEGVLLNTGVRISHESQIGAYSSLFSGSQILGRAQLDTGVLLGAGAAVAPGCRIGAWSKVSMASAVLADVPAYATVQGNPAAIIRQHQGPPPASLLPLPEH